MELYILTVDWYNDTDGHEHQILEVTDDWEKAHKAFQDYVNSHRQLDLDEGYLVVDDWSEYREALYYAHREMPDYHRVKLTFWN